MSGEAARGKRTGRGWRDFAVIPGVVFVAIAVLTSPGVRAQEPTATGSAVSAPGVPAPSASVEAPRPEPTATESADAASLLRMAEGYEQLGKLARAWKLCVRAAEQALLVGDVEARARALAKAETLSGGLARLTLQVSFFDRKPDTIWLDDEALGPGDLGLPIPLDPGNHRLIARRPGYVRWHKTFGVTAGKSYALTVPTLVLERPAPSPPPAVAAPGSAPPPTATVPVAPTASLHPSQEVATVLRLQREIARLEEARDDVSLTFPILMMAAGTGLTLAGGIDLVSRATGGSGVFGGGPTQSPWIGAVAIAGGAGVGAAGGVLLRYRFEKRRILGLLIERRLERLSRFGVSTGFGPTSATLTLHGMF